MLQAFSKNHANFLGIFWKFEANIQHFKGFGADKGLKFNILRGLEASIAPNPLKC